MGVILPPLWPDLTGEKRPKDSQGTKNPTVEAGFRVVAAGFEPATKGL